MLNLSSAKLRIVLTVTFFWAMCNFAQAQTLYPMPELSPNFDLAEYAAQTETITRTSDVIPSVSFRLSLPKNWVERMTIGQDYGELYRFDGPAYGDVKPYFSLRREQMNRENSAKNELIAYMLKNGYVLRSLNPIDQRNVEAFFVKSELNGDSFAVRVRGRIQGASLLLAEYAVPVDAWQNASDTQIYAINSFKFLKDDDTPVERRIRRNYYDALSFYYPASWTLEEEKADGENGAVISLANLSEQGVREGYIRISMYAGRNLLIADSQQQYPIDVSALLRDVRARYNARRLEIDAAIEKLTPDLNHPTKFSSIEVYPTRFRSTDYDAPREQAKGTVNDELWVALFQTDEDVPRTFLIELLTPARGQNAYVWSVNTRAFELILKSIQ